MDITSRTVQQVLVVELTGEIDDAAALKSAIEPIVKPGGDVEPGLLVALDLSGVTRMSAPAARAITEIARLVSARRGRVVLAAMANEIAPLFIPAGLALPPFRKFDSLREGLAYLEQVGTTRGAHAKPPATGPFSSSPPVFQPSPARPPAAAEAFPAPEEETGPRWLQAQLYALQAGEEIRLERALLSAAQHRLRIRIGHASKEWIAPPTADVFPEAALPPGEQYELRVVFWEPVHVPQPMVDTIYLPRGKGNSSVCEFNFSTAAGAPSFEGHVLIYHRGNCIQGMVLAGPVAADPALLAPGAKIELRRDAFVQDPRMLEAAPPANLSLYAANGAADLTVTSAAQARFRRMENMGKYVQRILTELNKVADAPEDYGALNDATTDLLRILARHGSLLYEELEDQVGRDNPIFSPANTRLELVSAVESVLPLELAYTRPSPYRQQVQLCPNHLAALQSGECLTCRDLDPDDAAGYVCPLGFFALQRVIERKAAKFDTKLDGADYLLQPELSGPMPRVGLSGRVILGASDKVGATRIEELRQTLTELTGAPVDWIRDWRSWKQAVKANAPSLLVLLPHTLERDDLLMLQIGDGSGDDNDLPVDAIREAHVRNSASYQPIVLLLGCETAAPDVPFQGFVPRFMRGGAAMVLTSLTPIRGRHAVPVAKILLNELKRATDQEHTLGDALLWMRRRCLAAGLPMVLSLVAYGEPERQLAA